MFFDKTNVYLELILQQTYFTGTHEEQDEYELTSGKAKKKNPMKGQYIEYIVSKTL